MSEESIKIRDTLAENAFDALKRAVEELAESPKDASIHWCSGLELLMKARLAHEHWSLVEKNPGTSPIGKVMAGEFTSVGYSEAIDRLANVAGTRWSKDDRKTLKSVSDHRNKVIHFYHPGFDDDKLREQVALDQCRAWTLFERLLEKEWSVAFPHLGDVLQDMHFGLLDTRSYLTARFEHLKPQIDAARLRGTKIDACYSCHFEAVLCEENEFQTVLTTCRVCSALYHYLRFTCPHCQASLRLEPEVSTACVSCKATFAIADLCGQLGLEVVPAGNCWKCWDWDDSTAHFTRDRSKIFCVGCLETFSTVVGACGRCGALFAGADPDLSVYSCPSCCNLA